MMKIRAIRQITRDKNHNAFTGARFFKGDLFVAFRQGDAHVCEHGKVLVLRSRDEGHTFDHVAVLRGEGDTRDAHLFAAEDRRLFVCGFESLRAGNDPGRWRLYPGVAWTDNGLNWSPWTRMSGCDGWVMWRPEYFRGRFYCSAYQEHGRGVSRIAWFESEDAVAWKQMQVLREGPDQPNECSLDFAGDGTAVMLVRREHDSKTPLLGRAQPPYRDWTWQTLDIPLAGPALWLVDNVPWISGRWFPGGHAAHVAVFRVWEGKPELACVLPSGPDFDCSYMGVARHPLNRRRFFLSYYSGHQDPGDPSINQFTHPEIFLAEAVFEGQFLTKWKVSALDESQKTLAQAALPDPARGVWKDIEGLKRGDVGFIDAHEIIAGRPGTLYFVTDVQVGPVDRGVLHLGYDGPVRAWVNGRQVFEGEGGNPATPDRSSVPVLLRHGRNQIAVALNTNGGKAWGIFARLDAGGA